MSIVKIFHGSMANPQTIGYSGPVIPHQFGDFGCVATVNYILDVNEALGHTHTSWMTFDWMTGILVGSLLVCFTVAVETTPAAFLKVAAPKVYLPLCRCFSRASTVLISGRLDVRPFPDLSVVWTVSTNKPSPVCCVPVRSSRLRSWWLFFLIYIAHSGVCGASEDEHVRAAFRQRHQAGLPPPPDPVLDRWTWAFRHYGLPQPPSRGYYDGMVHRADSILGHSPDCYGFQARYHHNALQILRSFAGLWTDVSDYICNRYCRLAAS